MISYDLFVVSSKCRQKGAALIVVMSLLSISLMVGLSSMQSSQIDERLAGNYRAKADAQMGAEQAASLGWKKLNEKLPTEWHSISDVEDVSWGYVRAGDVGGCTAPVSCYYRYVEDGVDKYILAMGGVEDGSVSVSELLAVKVLIENPPLLSFKFRDFSPLSILSDISEFNFSGNVENNFDIVGGEDVDEVTVSRAEDVEKVEVPSQASVGVKGYFDTVGELKSLVDFVKVLSASNDYFHYINKDPDMNDYSSGLLVVDSEKFTWSGRNNFNGVILFLGEEIHYQGGGSGSLEGALVHAPIKDTSLSTWSYAESIVKISGFGSSSFRYNENNLNDIDDEYEGLEGGVSIVSWQ